jgi:hypothetical protein
MGYLETARRRAQRRKSPWNLLLPAFFFVTWLPGWYFSVVLAGALLRGIRPELQDALLPDRNGWSILVAIGLLFAWLVPALVATNFLVWCIPLARRVLDREAHGFPGTDFFSSNRGLLRIGTVLVPLGLIVAAGGFAGLSFDW